MLFVGLTDSVGSFIESNKFQNIMSISDKSKNSLVRKNLQQLVKLQADKKSIPKSPLIVGESSEIQKLKKIITEAVRSKETVMITGEPGCGKDLVANVIHFRSNRNSAPMVKVNILAILKDRKVTQDFSQYLNEKLESFEVSDTNHYNDGHPITVLLDGIEYLTPALQDQVQIFLNTKNNDRFAPRTSRRREWRVISSSRLSIKDLIGRRQFDNKLFHQMRVYNIKIPPLRQRTEDIPLLSDFFCDNYSRQLSQPYYTISDETKNKLIEYYWPENIREFESTIKQMVVSGREQLVKGLPTAIHNGNPFSDASIPVSHAERLSSHIDRLFQTMDMDNFSLKLFCKELTANAEKQIISKVLKGTKWNRRKAAQQLDISYKSLLNKIKEYEINR